MSRLLRINASSRSQGSHSQETADYFQTKWFEANPDGELMVRNLAKEAIPHIEEATIAGFYTPKEQHDDDLKRATELSDRLIGELMSADEILISTPMYNFSVPSSLKAYIDQIVRIGHTFGYDEEKGLFGLVKNKRAYIVTASGAVFSGGALDAFNFLDPYVSALLTFLGFEDIKFFSIEGTTTDEAALARSRDMAHSAIDELFIGETVPA